MSKKIIAIIISIFLLFLITLSCSPGNSQSGQVNKEAGVEIAAEDPILDENPESNIVGQYVLRTSASEKLYLFDFKADMSITIEELYVDEGEGLKAAGTWQLGESIVEITIDDINGETPAEKTLLVIKLEDGFPYGIDITQGEEIENLEITGFSLGSGDKHTLLKELNRRLESIDYLEYEATEEDLVKYTEHVRKTVAEFQQSQGIVSNGVVDIETWRALKYPEPPVVYEGIAEKPDAEGYGDPDFEPVDKTDTGEKILYFTFDDGPYPKFSQQIIDEFARYDGQATFFVLGDQVNNFPDMVRTEIIDKNYIGNHTNSHTSLDGISKEQFIDEIKATEKAVVNAAGDLIPAEVRLYMRPPYGATDPNTRAYAAELGYYVVLWDIDTEDWRRPGAQQIADTILENAYPGAIILMHDGGGDREQTVEALKIALPLLKNQGYVFKNIFFKDFES